MSKKEEFKSVLKYGRCTGHGNEDLFSSAPGKCSRNNPAHAPRPCGFDYDRECGCCDDCRGTCIMLKMIRDSTKETVEEQYRKLVEGIDEEALKVFRDQH